MPEEMRQETMELAVTACEKHAASNEVHGLNDDLFRILTNVSFRWQRK